MRCYDKPTADREEINPRLTSFHDIQIHRLKRLDENIKTHGCKKAIRRAVCADLRNMDAEEFDETFSTIRFVPDAFLIDEEKLVVRIYEVEVSSPITLEKMHRYVDLMWLLDYEEWRLEIVRVDKYGKQEPVGLFEWWGDSVGATEEKCDA